MNRAIEPAGRDMSRAQRPLVSVLLLTWNHEAFIRACIQSILGESYENLELICCENGSSDATWTILQESIAEFPGRKVVLYQNPPGTPVNVGFNGLAERASGDLLCFFSGDDLFCKDRIETQVAAFEKNASLEILYGNGRFLGGHRDGAAVHDDMRCADVFEKSADEVLRYVFSNRGLMIQTMMARSSLIRAVGGFDERFLADDWILNIRVFRHLKRPTQYAYQPFIAFLYRQHDNNSYKKFPRQSKLMIDVIENYYDFPDRNSEIARMYYYQATVGANYGFQHLGLTLGYLRTALRLEIQPRNMLMIVPRFVLARPLRLYRMLRDRSRGRG